MKKILAGLLCAVVMFASTGVNYTAMAKESSKSNQHGNQKKSKGTIIYHKQKGHKESLYLDGVKFDVKIDESGNVSISGKMKGQKLNLTYMSDGDGNITAGKDKYDLDIISLNKSEIDVYVSKGNTVIYHYDDMSDFERVGYQGQAVAIPVIGKVLFDLALSVLIVNEIIEVFDFDPVITLHGYDWYDAEKAIEKIKADPALQDKYFPAYNYKAGNTFLIAFAAPLTADKAIPIVVADKPLDLYTYQQSNARDIIKKAGFWVEYDYPDFHANSKGLQFKHFHKTEHKTTSQFHSLYGIPVYVK